MSSPTVTLRDRLMSLFYRENLSPNLYYGILAEIEKEHSIVPKDPTEGQREAGYLARDNPQSVASLYRDMIKASPKVG